MILYEHPFNERTRTYLRLEHLFRRLGVLVARTDALDHHYALTTLFEVLDVSARADLKGETLKDLDKQRQSFYGFRSNAAIDSALLEKIIARLDSCFDSLNSKQGRVGHELNDNDLLMSIRSRIGIPGGTCEFDLPAYYAWQHKDVSIRHADLQRWCDALEPIANSIYTLLHLLRDAGEPRKVIANAGQFQQNLPQNRSFQLLRLQLENTLELVPEISVNRLIVSVRFMQQNAEGKLQMTPHEVPFELALCC